MAAPRQRRRANIESPHRPDDGGVTHSPEAIRQMGIAISAAAARTGASINPADPQLHNAIMRLIGTSGLERLARGDTAVLGIVDRFVGEHAAVIAQHQRDRDAHGPAHANTATPGSGETLTQRLLRLGAYGRTADDARDRPPGYSDLPGARIAGNADISGISMANYHTSPLTRAIMATGMNYGTFDYMRGQGFNRTHIQHAGEDARRHGYNPNNREVANDFGIVNRVDGARRAERNDLLERYRARLRGDAELRRLRAERERATTDEERSSIDAQARERDAIIRREMGVDRFVQQTPQAAQEADRRIFNREFSGVMGIHHQLLQQSGPEGDRHVSDRALTAAPPPVQPTQISGAARAVVAAPAQTQQQMDAEFAALGLVGRRDPPIQPAAAPGAQPPAGERPVTTAQPTPHRMASPTARA